MNKVDGGQPASGAAAGPRAAFRTTIVQSGKSITGIEVPAEIVARLGPGKRPPVRSTVAVRAGAYMVALSAENRAQAGVAGGDEAEVTLELDTSPREVTVPADL